MENSQYLQRKCTFFEVLLKSLWFQNWRFVRKISQLHATVTNKNNEKSLKVMVKILLEK